VLNQPASLKDKGVWARQRELQHAVLLYLTMNGPTSWDKLNRHFDKGATGEIAQALNHLTRWKRITVVGNIVKVPASGTARLSAGLPRST
jgi:hypothetical protein